ncbi:undecaprenyl-phosphate glucose phosphotransferase [Xylanibacter muris]|uniref:Undecaprenyl-phosphate glucose phosphotransferase n=1 Tax=Xylanibacter muris TaxID=2736290 RepID=A0ABX2AKU7_9BACT|nr:undecaprenyl-phosphate glucose phosphotransferase [Xylanibacter muris]NPD90867.1 undecaprenyl-phosphate glucose phosphotransferase [Xylanibacter muris]
MKTGFYDKHYNVLLSAATMVGDFLICVFLYILFIKKAGYWELPGLRQSLVVSSMLYIFCIYTGGVILFRRNTKNYQIPLLVFRNVIYYGIGYIIIMKLGHFRVLSPYGLSLFIVLLAVSSTIYRMIIRYSVRIYRSRAVNRTNAILVGSTVNNMELYREMTEVSYYGYNVLGYFDYEPNPDFPEKCPYLGTPDDVIGYLKEHDEVEELYCCLPSKYHDTIRGLIHYCTNNLIHFFSVPNLRNYLHNRMHFYMLGNVPYLSIYNEPLSRVENRMIKRVFDVVFSLTFLCTLFPIIFIIVFIITKITMPGPIFFRQKRNGLDNKVFYCLKFRSMKVNADADKLQATKNDPRKTKWGDIMRKTNIDELPQFINVLMGDMSIVGPRPHMLMHTEEYSKLIDKYMVRHFVKPGITGWSQVTGFRGETKELSQMEGRVKGDIWYMEHWTFGLDIYIIYKTIANAVKGDKAAY